MDKKKIVIPLMFLFFLFFFFGEAISAQNDFIVTVCIVNGKSDVILSSTAGLKVQIDKKSLFDNSPGAAIYYCQ